MAADGSEQVNLTNDASGDVLAAWSADGTRSRSCPIVLATARSTPWPLMDPTSSASPTIPGEDSNPSWAHDDTDIMFTSDRGGNVDASPWPRTAPTCAT